MYTTIHRALHTTIHTSIHKAIHTAVHLGRANSAELPERAERTRNSNP